MMPLPFALGFLGAFLCMWVGLLALGLLTDALALGRISRHRKLETLCIQRGLPPGVLLLLTGSDRLWTEDLFLCACAALAAAVVTSVVSALPTGEKNSHG